MSEKLGKRPRKENILQKKHYLTDGKKETGVR